MASYGYGYGGNQSQAYATVPPTGSYQNQAVGAAYDAQYQAQRAAAVQQSAYNTSGYGASAYGYGRQHDSATVHSSQGAYAQSSYVSRDPSYDSAKQAYYSTSQGSGGGYGYAAQAVKQSYQAAVAASSPYANSSQALTPDKQSQTYTSEAGNSAPTYPGYLAQGAAGSYASSAYSNPGSTQTQSSAQQKSKGNNPSQIQNAYEPVVYNAATSFLQQQSQHSKPQWQRQPKPQFRMQPGQRRGGGGGPGSQLPSRPERLHYCEVCKISCAGSQTYNEHLEGQKHKKKEAASSSESKVSVPPGSYRCELCSVTCTGADAYNAHVKGARHQKTLKLHHKLGKPIPESKGPPQSSSSSTTNVSTGTLAKVPGPRINFVGGTKLFTTSDGSKEEVADAVATESASETTAQEQDTPEEDGQIVGEEYVEPATDEQGKPLQGYKCTLCDCRFNDDVAKTAHLKGRRHRLSYKKKVQPSLRVDMKGSRRFPRTSEDRQKRPKDNELMWRQRQNEQMHWEHQLRMREEELKHWEEEEYMKKVGEDRYWTRPDRQRPLEMESYENDRNNEHVRPPMARGGGYHARGPTRDDRMVMAKHATVYPTDEELKQVQHTVAAAEKSLKLVSDQFVLEDNVVIKTEDVEMASETSNEATVSTEATVSAEADESTEATESTETTSSLAKPLMQQEPVKPVIRTLKGVMRVGVLAKGLLLRGQLIVELVVLCEDAPTTLLLDRVVCLLPEKLLEASEDKFSVELEDNQIVIKSETEPACAVLVTLTSPVVRQTVAGEDGADPEACADGAAAAGDVLDKEACLRGLASLRHAKWFQAKANGIQSCVIVIRIVRELRDTTPAFEPLSDWMIELIVEKALSSSRVPLAPGDAVRRVLEVLSSGLLLPDGSGLMDPCEREPVDAAIHLIAQQREDLTAAAQNALRLMAFRQLCQVLSMDPADVFGKGGRVGKRRHDSASSAVDSDTKVPRKDDDSTSADTVQEAADCSA